jgi:hypothetical protein
MKQVASFVGFLMILDGKNYFFVIYGEMGGSPKFLSTEFENDISPILRGS